MLYMAMSIDCAIVPLSIAKINFFIFFLFFVFLLLLFISELRITLLLFSKFSVIQ